MRDYEHFIIKNMRLIDAEHCEVYMLNTDRNIIKAWRIDANHTAQHRFYEQLNALSQAAEPFQFLLQLKQFYKVDVLR